METPKKEHHHEIADLKLELIGKILGNDDKRLLRAIGAVMDAYLEEPHTE